MQFKLKKELISGRYFVRIELTEYNENDQAKASKFGVPTIVIKLQNGSNAQAKITNVGRVDAYGFYTKEEADQYSDNLKIQIAELKKKWNSLEDSWSNEEIL